MKKLFFIITLFFAGAMFAQEDAGINLKISNVFIDTLIVGTTAVQAPDHDTAEWCQFMHEDATATVWLGGNSLQTLLRWGALQQYDTTERYPVINTDVFYFLSDEADTKVYILWGE